MQPSNTQSTSTTQTGSDQVLDGVFGDASVPDQVITVTLPDGSVGSWNISQNLTCRWGELNDYRADKKPLKPLIDNPQLFESLQNQMWEESTFVVRKDGQYGILFEREYATQHSEVNHIDPDSPGYEEELASFDTEAFAHSFLLKAVQKLAAEFPGIQFCLPPKEEMIEERLGLWAFVADGQIDDDTRELLGRSVNALDVVPPAAVVARVTPIGVVLTPPGHGQATLPRSLTMTTLPNSTPAIAGAVRDLRQSFIEKGEAQSYFEINNGLCEDFAIDLMAKIKDVTTGAMDICSENFMTGNDGDKSRNDVWDWPLLASHWGITPPEGLSADEMDGIDFGHHVWVAVGRRHYDAECPEGAESFFDLPLFRRYIVQHLREKGIAADEVVTEDVVPAPLCPVPNPLPLAV